MTGPGPGMSQGKAFTRTVCQPAAALTGAVP